MEAVLMVCGTAVLVILYSVNRSRKVDAPDGDGGLEERNQQRLQQEEVERGEALGTVQHYVGATTEFTTCSDMGSRLQKNWFSALALITVAPLSKNCILNLNNDKTLKMLNKVLKQLKHPHLVQVLSVDHDSKSGHVIVTQFKQGASLRDLVYQEIDSTRDWAEKYCTIGPKAIPKKAGSGPIRKPQALHVEAVATYGRQILEAVVYLYDQGFPALGHIQTGNIFVNVTKTEVKLGVGEGEESGIPKGAGSSIQEGVGPGIRDGMESEDTGLKMGPEDGAEKGEGLVDAGEEAKSAVCVHMEDVDTYCRLGGHENTLLGYRPRLYRNIVNAGELERIDIISFGHVMYEIGCGCELEGVCPTDAEYAEISDVNFSSVLRKIFDHKMSVSEMLTWPFFAHSAQPQLTSESKPLPHALKAFLNEKYSGKKNWLSTAVNLPFNLFRGLKK